MTAIFSVDGVEYRHVHVVSLKRAFSVLDGDNAGRTMDGNMQRDIIGTYYNYSLELDPDGSDPEEYDDLYEVLSAPQESHVVTFPYGQSVLTFRAYVANGDDALGAMAQKNEWGGLTVNFVAMKPARRPL